MFRHLHFYLGIVLMFISIFLIAENIPVMEIKNSSNNDSEILAEYNGGVITRKDLETKISKLPPQYQARYKTVGGQIEVLNAITTEEVFYQKAKQMGLENDPTVLEYISAIEKRFYIQEYYKRNVSDLVIITDDTLLSYYNQNLSLFYQYPYITIDYIQAENEEAAKKALAELKKGVAFAAVSDTYNQNTYAKGLKGRIKNIRLNGNIPGIGNDPELENLIRSSQVDTLNYIGPVKTDYGWHILRIVDWIEGYQKDFNEVKPEIEQRVRPMKEQELLNALTDSLKIKYAVVIDSAIVNTITLDPNKRNNNKPILDNIIVSSKEPSLQFTVRQMLQIFDKLSPQEQLFINKSGGINMLINQELTQGLMYLEAKANGYEKYFTENEDYLQAKRAYVLRSAFQKLVSDTIEISAEEVAQRYEREKEKFSTPAYRTIEVLFFDNNKDANTAWKKYNKAYKKHNEQKMQDIIKKYSLKPENAILDYIYNNGIITGIGQDPEFSSQIWNNPVGYLSPVFTSAKGDIVFFRTLKETPKLYKSIEEIEPQLRRMIKSEKEKAKMEQVTEELFVEFNMKKYPERINLTMTAEELFNQADNAARQRNFKDAIMYYDQIIESYKNNSDDYKASFMKAFLIAEEMKQKDLALQLFKDFLIKYPTGDLNESAQFMIDSLEGRIPEDFEPLNED
ncbi:MAG TPA: peptidyl-prolyl cis-trans isomerase [Candidatus Cloacimonas sp.]|nr:peptidyl-prolyl cis-trans isomerase [Candidatus Cloacimonas sp.]